MEISKQGGVYEIYIPPKGYVIDYWVIYIINDNYTNLHGSLSLKHLSSETSSTYPLAIYQYPIFYTLAAYH